MSRFLDAAFDRSRTVILIFLALMVTGAMAYVSIPKEAEPDVTIPTMYISVYQDGISPEDSERLLVRPLEKELQSIEGLDEMRASATENYATITLEFEAGFDSDRALQDVREKVDIAKSELPADAEEPRVQEVNVALFPVLTAVLSGSVPERTLVELSREVKDRLEALPGVLEVDIGGSREDVVEVLLDPTTMQTYGLSYEEVLQRISNNNQLVAAGNIDTGAGRIALKVPGVVENFEEVREMPIKVDGDRVVTVGDVGVVRRTYKDPEGFARVGGQPALALEIKKRVGANIIETIAQSRAAIEQMRQTWPAGVEVAYLQDKSENVRTLLGDLQNNVMSAIVLVMIVVIAALGLRSALLVGLAIPGAFLAGILVLDAMGFTLNIVVLFSLIMVVGMLVDGAIVVVELADRKMDEGEPRAAAFAGAAKRMFWPITAGIATTVAVFFPLLFWPGVVGEFMQYLPITVIVTLVASLAMALVFIPVIGKVLRGGGRSSSTSVMAAAEGGDLSKIGGVTGWYVGVLRASAKRPASTIAAVIGVVIGAYALYGALGKGIEFFPDVEPDFAQVQIQARGNLSIHERDDIVRRVEERLLGNPVFENVYARTIGGGQSRRNMAEDVIGVIQLELTEWDTRPPAAEVLAAVREQLSDIAGVKIQVREEQGGPSQGKPVQIELTTQAPEQLPEAVAHVREAMREVGGFVDVTDSRPLPGVEWRLEVDRAEAARYGADISLLGYAVQMVTNGVKVAEYQPDDTDEEVDIRVRFPFGARSLEQLDQLTVPTANGQVPIGNFVRFEPAPKTGTIDRVDAERVMTVEADVAEGLLVDTQVQKLQAALAEVSLPRGTEATFKGENEDIAETMDFLVKAFIAAVGLMLILLVTQFNSIFQALLVMSAIVLSTAGVLLGLLIRGEPFGVVMAGIGVIALAGIVVNNNIVLIDTYNDLRRRARLDPLEAALRTGAQRLRPVVLTVITTVLGLMPMVLAMNVDMIGREIAFGAPSTQWWTQLSAAIAGGLVFATILTLILTPTLLVAGERVSVRLRRGRVGADARQPA
ncbi:efflux RND transporter permease subunit [Dichotomicrobium thermohalophilum]|uniref:Multidrug efflux pump n=1 Tax=Dichotomicrobium thermohalophilum TaxID=933063 RepID=A0A397PE43_9HYPH|nr:efflux RND transporter permease subunit [Dichotomicrobium thermohalophilum]RIA45437.1 multidrug efflux pump [Dichotomicrobium thermohalophilum]